MSDKKLESVRKNAYLWTKRHIFKRPVPMLKYGGSPIPRATLNNQSENLNFGSIPKFQVEDIHTHSIILISTMILMPSLSGKDVQTNGMIQ